MRTGLPLLHRRALKGPYPLPLNLHGSLVTWTLDTLSEGAKRIEGNVVLPNLDKSSGAYALVSRISTAFGFCAGYRWSWETFLGRMSHPLVPLIRHLARI